MSELDAEISVLPYATVASAAVDQAIDEVFFQSSGTPVFASEAARAAFRQRWLGRYLRGAAEHTFVAMTGDGEAVGYLVGGIVDPALDELSTASWRAGGSSCYTRSSRRLNKRLIVS